MHSGVRSGVVFIPIVDLALNLGRSVGFDIVRFDVRSMFPTMWKAHPSPGRAVAGSSLKRTTHGRDIEHPQS